MEGPRQELSEIPHGGDHLSHPPGIQLHDRCGKITKDTNMGTSDSVLRSQRIPRYS